MSDKRKYPKLDKEAYEEELKRLQAELVEMQQWVVETGNRIVIIMEGRDAAGKGSAIKRITQYLNPRTCRVEALPAPNSREQGQWYFQRYIERLPTAGEIVIFDRSWYNRAGVERVMGFCTSREYRRFLHQAPIFERLLIEDGIMLRKYWFSVSDEEQIRRFSLVAMTRCVSGNSHPWTCSPLPGGKTTRALRMKCSSTPIFRRPRGTPSRAKTRSAPASTSSPTCYRPFLMSVSSESYRKFRSAHHRKRTTTNAHHVATSSTFRTLRPPWKKTR